MSRAPSTRAAPAAPPASPANGGAQRSGPRERPIDLVHLARQTFGDKRLETELLRLFMRQAEQIQASLDAGERNRPAGQPIGEVLHMLQGSARVVGATAVADLAQDMEAEWRRAGANRPGLPEAARTRLRDAVVRTNAYIASLLGPQ